LERTGEDLERGWGKIRVILIQCVNDFERMWRGFNMIINGFGEDLT